MSLPKGGKREGSGRKAGTPNKITADVKAFAFQFGREAIEGLVSLARAVDTPPAARVSAWNSILDRGLGKPTQAVELSGAVGIERIERVVVDSPANSNAPGLPALTRAG